MKLFLDQDKETADAEIDCYGYLLKIALEEKMHARFRQAAIHHENIARSLHSLADMKASKEMHDEALLILKQIEGSRQHKELIERLNADAKLDY